MKLLSYENMESRDNRNLYLFILPPNTYPLVEVLDYGTDEGLQILIPPCKD